jgi:hypothetical protein
MPEREFHDVGAREKAQTLTFSLVPHCVLTEAPEANEQSKFTVSQGATQTLNIRPGLLRTAVLALHLDYRRFQPERVAVRDNVDTAVGGVRGDPGLISHRT